MVETLGKVALRRNGAIRVWKDRDKEYKERQKEVEDWSGKWWWMGVGRSCQGETA